MAPIVRPSALLPSSAAQRCRFASSVVSVGRLSVTCQLSMCWDGSIPIDLETRRRSLSTNRPTQAPAGRGRRIFRAASTSMVTGQVRQRQQGMITCGRYCAGLLSYRSCSTPCSLAEGFPERYVPKPKENSVHVEIILRALKKAGVSFEDFEIISFRNNINKICKTMTDNTASWALDACCLSDYPRTTFLNIHVRPISIRISDQRGHVIVKWCRIQKPVNIQMPRDTLTMGTSSRRCALEEGERRRSMPRRSLPSSSTHSCVT